MEIGRAEQWGFMSISVHAVDFEADREQFFGVLQANLPNLPHPRRFEWLYRANPDGPAWSWLARQKGTGRAVGVASVFPRSMWIGHQLKKCGQVGDFAVDRAYRTLGPAVMLQRATFEPVEQEKLAFCYDCPPHDAGMSTFRRLGLLSNCVVERYVLPLRLDEHVGRYAGPRFRFLAIPGNLLLHRYRHPKWNDAEFDINEHPGAFQEEFSELDSAVRYPDAIRACRSAAHLNWRYRRDPLQEYAVLTARRRGELAGYLIFQATPDHVKVVDLFGRASPGLTTALLGALIQRCKAPCQRLEAYLSPDSEWIAPFLALHFCRRSTAAQIVAYAKAGHNTSGFLQRSPRWAFQNGDIRA